MSKQDPLEFIIAQFQTTGKIKTILPFGSGNINHTYHVTTSSPQTSYILQQINTAVFPHPEQIIDNFVNLTRYYEKIGSSLLPINCGYQFPFLLPTRNGSFYFRNKDNLWRLMTFIPETFSLNEISTPQQGAEVGKMLAFFHRWTADLPVHSLKTTLPGFHCTPQYLKQYDRIIPNASASLREKAADIITFIEHHRSRASILEEARTAGIILPRVTHGDPKAANILFAKKSGCAVSLIDLDTVQPGLIQHDLGDCLRSCCNRQGEDPAKPEKTTFDTKLYREILKSYLEVAGTELKKNDLDYIYEGIFIITYELALRFLNDYLSGNIYFKINDAEHNLRRALTQMYLAQSIEHQKESLQDILKTLSSKDNRKNQN